MNFDRLLLQWLPIPKMAHFFRIFAHFFVQKMWLRWDGGAGEKLQIAASNVASQLHWIPIFPPLFFKLLKTFSAALKNG